LLKASISRTKVFQIRAGAGNIHNRVALGFSDSYNWQGYLYNAIITRYIDYICFSSTLFVKDSNMPLLVDSSL